MQVLKLCTDLGLSLFYILMLRTYSKFARKNYFLALGVCFPQPCSSAGRMFARPRSRVQNYRWIVSFPHKKIDEMCCNWIPLRICVRLRNNQPHLKSGPVPSILDDLCLGNVISKYFSKLRVGTSKIQPKLKCLENILSSFYESLLRARLWEHELFIIRSIAFISTLVKSPDEALIKYKAFYTRYSRECHISCLESTWLFLAHNSLVSEPYRGTGK